VDSDLDHIRSGFNDIVDLDPIWANPDGGWGVDPDHYKNLRILYIKAFFLVVLEWKEIKK
jgi:hypothetical protein